eukprot:NODE_3927_length_861_cov_31.852217_g3258_i0.p1 GENE.NODE_3927_length_861_cov_31.852217_g3258_i0~~NODE_3927_length_861_cov_31.852217_g3258_i0.p1  ORF type:complete len:220 (-),score=52.55 NODE_3927_length_861_cov_31.852217_g3258_i0:200-832(-)
MQALLQEQQKELEEQQRAKAGIRRSEVDEMARKLEEKEKLWKQRHGETPNSTPAVDPRPGAGPARPGVPDRAAVKAEQQRVAAEIDQKLQAKQAQAGRGTGVSPITGAPMGPGLKRTPSAENARDGRAELAALPGKLQAQRKNSRQSDLTAAEAMQLTDDERDRIIAEYEAEYKVAMGSICGQIKSFLQDGKAEGEDDFGDAEASFMINS